MERIHKFQPNRTIQLRGFDDLGAAAALHSATADSFRVSGVFREPGDFAVLVLYDADNFYEHPSLKHLPDTNFSGINLSFDVHYAGLQPLDSVKYPTISWPYLEVIRPDHTTAQVHLLRYATQTGGTYAKASADFTVIADGVQAGDQATIWYQNYAFDYVAAGGETAEQAAAGVAQAINNANFGAAQAIEAEANGAILTVRAARPGRDGNMITVYAQWKTESLKLTPDAAKLSGGSSDATWRVTLRFSDAIGEEKQPDGLIEMRPVDQIRQCWLTFAPELADGAAFTDTDWEATFSNWSVEGENKWLQVAGPGSLRLEETDPALRYSGNSWSVEAGFFSEGFAQRAEAAGDSVTIRYESLSEHDLYVGTSLFSTRVIRDSAGNSVSVAAGKWGVTVDGDGETELNTYLPVAEPVNTRRLVRQRMAPGKHTVALRLLSGTAYFDFLEVAVPSDIPAPEPLQDNLAPALDYSTDHTYKLPPERILWMFDQLGYGGPLNLYLGVFWYNQRRRVDGSPWGLLPLAVASLTVTFAGEFLADDQVIISIGGEAIGKTIYGGDTPERIAKHFEYFVNSNYVGVWAKAEGASLTITVRSTKAAYSYGFDGWVERKENGTYFPLRPLEWTGSLEGSQPGIWQVDPEQEYGVNRGARVWLADMFSLLAARGREMVVASSMELVHPPAGFGAAFPDGAEVVTDVGFGSLHSTHCAFNSAMRAHHAKVYRTVAGLMSSAGLTPNLQFGEFLWWFFPRRTLTPLAVANATPIEIYFSAPHGLNTGDRLVNAGYQGCTAANGTWTVTYVNAHQVALNGSAGNGAWVSATGTTKTGGMAFYDEETRTAAEAALGRPLHRFESPVDDPQVNGGADATFLRGRLRDYVAALVDEIRAAYPETQFELLFPYDVNYPQLVGINQLGGRLNRFVNLPAEWESKSGSGLDRLKIEALDFGASNKNLDLARTAMRFPVDLLQWPRDSLRYLAPIFRAGYPWEKEYRTAIGLGYPAVNLWAFDHICIYGLTLRPSQARALYMG
ncbi:MAG: hypothetical protein KIT09_15255 [Bryobacteraceae bacterium]|nr:hypothetical protein [Bryobacteraceae bacterium]